MTSSSDQPTVSRLRVYPLKGGRGLEVDTFDLDTFGPRHDRRWMVVGPDGRFLSQRSDPTLARVVPEIASELLTLSADGHGAVSAPVSNDGEAMTVQVWSSTVDAVAVSREADAWLSAVLGHDVRLVYMPDDGVRDADARFSPDTRVAFVDTFPLLVLSEASVAGLGDRLGRPVDMDRFRPNVVVRGVSSHDEDRWARFTVGDLAMKGVKLCGRCKVPTHDQVTGERDPGGEPIRTLACYRQIEQTVYFGLMATHERPGTLHVGDVVEVLERGTVATGQ